MRLALFLLMPYVALAAGAAVAFVIYPNYKLSTYRYQLWQLRDELISDVVAGRIDAPQAVAEALDCLDMLIAHADAMTLRNGFAAFYAFRHDAGPMLGREHLDDETVLEGAGVAAVSTADVRQVVLRARDAGVHQMMTGSLGAPAFMLLTILGRPLVRFLKPGRIPGGGTLAREVVELSASMPTSKKSLASYC